MQAPVLLCPFFLHRESVDVEDLFYAHISGMDAMARGLKQAAAIINDGRLDQFVADRYESYEDGTLPEKDLSKTSFQELEKLALAMEDPGNDIQSAQQEKAEIIFNFYT